MYMKCWCGVEGDIKDLFQNDGSGECNGTGELDCHCGGDQCICHNHGTFSCPGCLDCKDEDEEIGDGEWD